MRKVLVSLAAAVVVAVTPAAAPAGAERLDYTSPDGYAVEANREGPLRKFVYRNPAAPSRDWFLTFTVADHQAGAVTWIQAFPDRTFRARTVTLEQWRAEGGSALPPGGARRTWANGDLRYMSLHSGSLVFVDVRNTATGGASLIVADLDDSNGRAYFDTFHATGSYESFNMSLDEFRARYLS